MAREYGIRQDGVSASRIQCANAIEQEARNLTLSLQRSPIVLFGNALMFDETDEKLQYRHQRTDGTHTNVPMAAKVFVCHERWGIIRPDGESEQAHIIRSPILLETTSAENRRSD